MSIMIIKRGEFEMKLFGVVVVVVIVAGFVVDVSGDRDEEGRHGRGQTGLGKVRARDGQQQHKPAREGNCNQAAQLGRLPAYHSAKQILQ